MTYYFLRSVSVLVLTATAVFAQSPSSDHPPVMLPTSKMLTVPAPGRVGSTNSFPATMVLSPDGRYAALLNDGYGTQETLVQQSISVLDLQSNQVADYPDARFASDSHQSYFLGLAFSSDGKHLYASVGSLTDPTGARTGDTGNGIAVYGFSEGKVTPQGFIPIGPQPLKPGKHVAIGLQKTLPNKAIPYPAGLTMVRNPKGEDWLIVANNLSDNIVVLDPVTGKTLETFDMSTQDLVPSTFPYTCVATRHATRAWCSLWNTSQIVQIELIGARIGKSIDLSGIERSAGSELASDCNAVESGRKAFIRCALQCRYNRRGRHRDRNVARPTEPNQERERGRFRALSYGRWRSRKMASVFLSPTPA